MSYGAAESARAVSGQDTASLRFGAVGQAFEVSQSFNPPSRSAPARTADGGTRRFNPQSRSAPERTADGGTRNFDPPGRGTPERTADGGSRGCFRPIASLDPGQAMPLTVSERPTFYWHVPAGAAPQVRFVLRPASDESKTVYETYMNVPEEDSIISLTLPEASEKALEVGETYHWYLVAVCDTTNPYDGVAIDGWIERVEPSDSLASNLKANPERQQPTVYAEAGIWHEAIEGFVNQRQLNPGDATLAQQWQEFLGSVGLAAYADVPVVSWQPIDE